MNGHHNLSWHSSVDPIAGVYFAYQFEVQYFKARGTAFQRLFTELMQAAFGESFWATGTYGNVGDLKCDGYLKTERRVFAVYAPNDLSQKMAQAKKKVADDHAGAQEHWRDHMDTWTLVHNGRDGLPAPLQKHLLDLEARAPTTPVCQWSFSELLGIVQRLTLPQLTAIFGPAPSKRDFAHAATQQDLARVIAEMAATLEHGMLPTATEASVDLREVPKQKIEYNKLSRSVRQWLSVGRPHAAKVNTFFERHTDVDLADRVVRAFRRRYEDLRSDPGRSPDEVFALLDEYAGGGQLEPRIKLAAVAVVAYLFEACHIFERPPDTLEASADAAPNKDPLAGPITDRLGSGRTEAP
jgi:hypothetical protein